MKFGKRSNNERPQWKFAKTVKGNCEANIDKMSADDTILFLLRTFFPGRLEKHQKFCTKQQPMKPVRMYRIKDSGIAKSDEVVECCCENHEEHQVRPTMEDFTTMIEESNILDNKSLSLQLLLLIDIFMDNVLLRDKTNH